MTPDGDPPPRSTVLIVDDEHAVRAALVRLLERAGGYECVQAANLDDARNALTRCAVDLLITDLNLGDESGLDLAREALESDPQLAVLMVTGVDDPVVAQEALDFGAFGYVVKPFGLTEMRIAVMNAIRRRELEIARLRHTAELESLVETRTAELLDANRELVVRAGRLKSLVESSPMGILYGDTTGKCQIMNERGQELLEVVGGDDPRQWLTAVHPADRDALLAAIGAALGRVPKVDVDLRIVRADGSSHWRRAHTSPVIGDLGEVSGFVTVVEDIDERRRMEQQLRHQATHDYLTQLPNRRFVQKALSDALTDLPAGCCVGVAVVDLDQFKLVNDTYGHAAGDQLIKYVAGQLEGVCGADDIVARFGGDEFVAVLIGRTDPRDLLLAVEDMRAAVEGPTFVEEAEVFVTVSVGLAMARDAQVPAPALLRNADIAMHRAKDQGRNRLEVFDDGLRRAMARRLVVSNALRRSLDGESIDVHYQPQYDTRTGALAGLEALARWHDADLGVVGPDEFIPAAEAAGLVHLIDRRVMREACSQLARWQRSGIVARSALMSVNISARQLTDPEFVGIVKAEIARSGIAPGALCLEITETVVMNEISRAIAMLAELRELGVKVAVDDFGTGYSSLSYLRSLPVDFLKIDRSFVTPLGGAGMHRDASVVAAIIDLAHHFDMEVVAEGVENKEQLSVLRDLGCDYAQGFLYSPPLPAGHERIPEVLKPATGSSNDSGNAEAPERLADSRPASQCVPAVQHHTGGAS